MRGLQAVRRVRDDLRRAEHAETALVNIPTAPTFLNLYPAICLDVSSNSLAPDLPSLRRRRLGYRLAPAADLPSLHVISCHLDFVAATLHSNIEHQTRTYST